MSMLSMMPIVRNPIWRGDFLITGEQTILRDGLQAHLATNASPNVREVVNRWDSMLLLDEVPRTSTWPVQFKEAGAKEDHIGLYFFAEDLESYNRSYTKLLKTMMEGDLALKGNFDGVDLLIFPSSHLPQDAQRWNTMYYLWGVFRVKKEGNVDPNTKTIPDVVNVQPSLEDCEVNLFDAEQYSPTPGTSARTSPFNDLVILMEGEESSDTSSGGERNMKLSTDLSFLSRAIRNCPSLLSDPRVPPLPAPIRVRCSQLVPPVDDCSFNGEKVDPEPVRCSRTDGKKRRCSKDTYGDSEFCEKHMHRGHKRPSMPVEPLQTTVSSHSSLSSTVSPVTDTGVPLQNIDKGPQTDNNNNSSTSGGAGHNQNIREWSG